jgi:hypothetical protein
MFFLNMERNDTMTARSYRAWALAEEKAPCDQSTLDIWRLYDCVYTPMEECMSGNSWYRVTRFSFIADLRGPEPKYHNGYEVIIYKDGLIVRGIMSYNCSRSADLQSKEQWILSWLRSIRILTDEEWNKELKSSTKY